MGKDFLKSKERVIARDPFPMQSPVTGVEIASTGKNAGLAMTLESSVTTLRKPCGDGLTIFFAIY